MKRIEVFVIIVVFILGIATGHIIHTTFFPASTEVVTRTVYVVDSLTPGAVEKLTDAVMEAGQEIHYLRQDKERQHAENMSAFQLLFDNYYKN